MSDATTTEVLDPTPKKGPSQLVFWLTACLILAYCGTLLGAFGIQFFQHEFPCPLCMLQRYAMILVTIPAMWIMADALRGKLTRSRYARALGLSIIASIAGSLESTRQILLHIASKTDPGYGSAVLGLHLYTWALITFVIVIVFCGIMLLVIDVAVPLAPESPKLRVVAKSVLWLFMAVLVANVIAIIFLEGFSWVLPDNPTGYRLVHQLGLR